MHVHFSAVTALGVFLAVLVWGTLWRLVAAHLGASNKPAFSTLGRAMSFQY